MDGRCECDHSAIICIHNGYCNLKANVLNHRRHTQGHGLSNHSRGTIHCLQNLTKQSTRAIYKILGYWMKIRYHKNLLLSYNSFVVLKLCLSEGSVLPGMNSQRLLRMKALTMSLETSVFLLSWSIQPDFSQWVFGTQAINTEKEIVINKNGLVFQFPLGHLTLIIPVNNWVFFRFKAIPSPFIEIV